MNKSYRSRSSNGAPGGTGASPNVTGRRAIVQQNLRRLRKPVLRHNLVSKLLREQPHLRPNTGPFRERFVLRSIYVVGPDISTLANYTGFSRAFVMTVQEKYVTEAMKAMRGFVEGRDWEPTIIESVKQVVHTVARAIEKKSIGKRFKEFGAKLFGGKRLRTAQ